MKSTAATLRDRAAGYFVAPSEPAAGSFAPPRDRAPGTFVAPGEAPMGSSAASRDSAASDVSIAPRAMTLVPSRYSPRAAVLGSAADAPPVAAALANALRGRRGAPAAVAVWAPPPRSGDPGPPPAVANEPPGGAAAAPRSGPPASLAASRLAARLTARGLPAAARGRLAWLRLLDHPVAAALAARRLSGALEAPLVIAVAGPRSDALEGLLREQDLIVVVAREPDGPLARLALARCDVPSIACAPLPHGPARLLALAGLAGARTLDAPLRTAARDLAGPPPSPAHATASIEAARTDW